MTHPITCAARYRDAHHILNLAEDTLPFPKLSEDRATFFFVGLPADEAPQAVADAQTILSYGLNAAFLPRRTKLGSTAHYILTAVLPSGMKVELVALGEHFAADREVAPVPAGSVAA